MGTIISLIIAFLTLTVAPSTTKTLDSKSSSQVITEDVVQDDYTGNVVQDDYTGN